MTKLATTAITVLAALAVAVPAAAAADKSHPLTVDKAKQVAAAIGQDTVNDNRGVIAGSRAGSCERVARNSAECELVFSLVNGDRCQGTIDVIRTGRRDYRFTDGDDWACDSEEEFYPYGDDEPGGDDEDED